MRIATALLIGEIITLGILLFMQTVNFGILWLMATLVTGGEVEDAISGCLLHDPFKGRRAGLFRCFSP
jgi:hypothetical protein